MSQEIIDVGTVANDGTGDTLRDAFTKTNNNFSELFSTSAVAGVNVVVINSLADFPDPVGGVIELTSGLDMTYVVNPSSINLGTNRFTVTGGSVVVIGTSRFASQISSSTTLDLFTVNSGHLGTEFISLNSPASPYLINFIGDGTKSLVVNNTVMVSCQKFMSITGAFTTSLRTVTYVASSVGGMEWFGADGSQINMTNCFGFSWTGSLIDLGAATFDLIVISSDNRLISPSGTVILEAAAANANIKAGGRALVSGTIFNGVGTTLSGGITTQDIQWSFIGNTFAGGSFKNTSSSTKGFISTTTTAPTAAAGSGVFAAIAGSNWTTNDPKRWTVSTAGIMTFIGLDDISFFITHHSAGEPASGGSQLMQTQLYINGSPQAETIGEATDSNTAQMAGDGIFNISNGDTLQLFAAIVGSVDIDFSHSGISALALE